MEKQTAILIADLSGYTALTATHGPAAAADLIDTYIEIVNECLAGSCVLHQRVGDEIVITSDSADCILSTAAALLKKSVNRHRFLQLHGGLHWGNILLRNGNYFGTTINLASRIAASAPAGSFYCSSAFVDALQSAHGIDFHSKGAFRFKNLEQEAELFELGAGDICKSHIDPVCRMLISDFEAVIRHTGEEELYFCSKECYDKYVGTSSAN